jgi:predicted phosphodiesterase
MSAYFRITLASCFFAAAFIASCPLLGQEKVTVALWGDSRENLDNACENIASVLLHDITDWDVQVHTGDFTHHGSEEDWQRSLGYKGIQDLFVPGRFLLCTSNHDSEREVKDTFSKKANWDKYTRGVLPVNDEDGTTHFYAWHKGNVHIVFCDGFFTDSTTMQRWLDRYLEKVQPEDWLVGVWHDPAFDLTYKEQYLPTCRPWLESLARHGGDFVFNGHAHLYLRSQPLLPDGTVDEARGMVHVINGTGGASWKDPAPAGARTAFTPAEKSFPCITFVTFEGNTARIRTVDARPEKHLQTIDSWAWTR